MNDTMIIKEKIDRLEKMILQIMERLQALEMDNVKNKSQIERTANSFNVHIGDPDGHKV